MEEAGLGRTDRGGRTQRWTDESSSQPPGIYTPAPPHPGTAPCPPRLRPLGPQSSLPFLLLCHPGLLGLLVLHKLQTLLAQWGSEVPVLGWQGRRVCVHWPDPQFPSPPFYGSCFLSSPCSCPLGPGKLARTGAFHAPHQGHSASILRRETPSPSRPLAKASLPLGGGHCSRCQNQPRTPIHRWPFTPALR